MALTDLRDALDLPLLKLPIGGKDYTVAPCSARAWLRLQEINDRAAEAMKAGEVGADLTELGTGITEAEMFQFALGPTYDLLMDEVSMPEVRHAGITAYYWQLGDERVAISVWESAGKAPAPTTAPRRRTSSSTRSASTTTASRTTTRSRKK